ncbi:trypsin-like peptidase domain-containing protein [Scytonema hofmannii FACHB-248]|uniref:Trypsin-like peptidase domain-containing protein n=1 Tax=Scytonema hofmannii FACHB-248 TaxID=1842502 RepID=A0ABR8GR50_9CYAN|nr:MULTISPECIES: serine protease [Nostocales]MBD2605701.1 trypsin-like peptidase domain-containing protein [Scytonema hofmannii FACHB-248]
MTTYVILPNTGVPVPVPGLGLLIFLVDNLGEPVPPVPFEEASPDERAEMIVRRLAPKKNPAISAVFGEPDFLPFPFLQIGIKQGAAVCRLVRKFANEDSAEKFLKIIKTSQESINRSFSPEDLAEILAVDEEERPTFVQKFQKSLEDFTPQELVNMECVPTATGFLVGRNYLLTNYHVFPEKTLENQEATLVQESVSEYIAQFSYEQDFLGRKIEPISYQLERIVCFDKTLDYVLAKLNNTPTNSDANLGQAGDIFNWIPMSDDPMRIAPPITDDITDELLQQKLDDAGIELNIETLKNRAKFGEPVNIIQHPKGRRKEIILSNNWSKKIFKDFIEYEADADFSSSGSPVLNQQWQLVALHHATIAEEFQENGIKKFKTVGQKGIRISSIVEDMRNKGNQGNKEFLQFIKEFVSSQNSSTEKSQEPNQKPPYAQSY